MARGELVGTIAMTEPAAGSDLQGIKTTARRDGRALKIRKGTTPEPIHRDIYSTLKVRRR